MTYKESDYLLLSGLQHFAFCRRQWALIHIENQWAENLRTTEGNIMHERAHDANIRERRGDVIIARGLGIRSVKLGISGSCDVVEFHADPCGVTIAGESGKWRPHPVEYKRGSPKTMDGDRLQLCAQAMCLEEMLCCDISEGSLFYGETRRRERVTFTEELRSEVSKLLDEMHQLAGKGYTPKCKPSRSCGACSLKDLCLPKLMRVRSAAAYITAAMEDGK